MEQNFKDEESKRRLIAEVKKYNYLYDPSQESYHIKQTRATAWAKVSAACGCPGSEDVCQKTWKGLREKFKREKEKVNSARSSNATKPSRLWSLYSAMSFIDQFLHARPSISNAPERANAQKDKSTLDTSSDDGGITCASVETESLAADACEENAATTSPLEVSRDVTKQDAIDPSHPNASPTEKESQLVLKIENRKRKASDADTISVTILNTMEKEGADKEPDAIQQFYSSMANEARKLSDSRRLQLQMNILQLTINAIEAEGH